MAGDQQHKTSRRSEEAEQTSEVDSSDAVTERKELDDDVDSMLDEIDDVLEENAEEFVRGFVQKGGQ